MSYQITDDTNDLTQEQRDEISLRFTEVLPSLPECELCKTNKWSFNRRLVSPSMLKIDLDEKSFSTDFAVIHPSLMMHCQTCGNTKFFSLGLLGYDPFTKAEKK